MIRTKLAYGAGEIIINPYTVSYIIRNEMNETTVGFTNGHQYSITMSPLELMEVINNETKSLCKECTKCVPTQDVTNRGCIRPI